MHSDLSLVYTDSLKSSISSHFHLVAFKKGRVGIYSTKETGISNVQHDMSVNVEADLGYDIGRVLEPNLDLATAVSRSNYHNYYRQLYLLQIATALITDIPCEKLEPGVMLDIQPTAFGYTCPLLLCITSERIPRMNGIVDDLDKGVIDEKTKFEAEALLHCRNQVDQLGVELTIVDAEVRGCVLHEPITWFYLS